MTTDPLPSLLSLVSETAPAPVASHEHELISALLDSGTYNPSAYGVPATAFRGSASVHGFCSTYQDKAGCAPPVSVVRTRFPSFTYVPGLSAAWAAHNVSNDETDRYLRKNVSKALNAIGEEAYGEAVGILRETVSTVTTASSPGRLVTDFSVTREQAGKAVCPVPEGHLAELTGGHGAGQVWFIAALWGVGKTYKLIQHSVHAAEHGWDVAFFSLEMPTEDVLSRLRQQALRSLGPLPLVDLDTQEREMADWAQGCGRVEVHGPERGRVDASVISAAITSPRTLVVVDYIGKMFSTDGRHAKTGHDVTALISAELQQTAGLLGVPILGAAQLNRVGQVAGSISIEQDADLILHQQRVAETVNGIRKNTIYKTRHTGGSGHWYSRFDPLHGDFSDISHEEAMRIRMSEESSAWS